VARQMPYTGQRKPHQYNAMAIVHQRVGHFSASILRLDYACAAQEFYHTDTSDMGLYSLGY